VVTIIAPARATVWDDGKLNIAGARRQIEDEHIEFAPFHLPQEIAGCSALPSARAKIAGELSSSRNPIDINFNPYCSIGRILVFFRRHRLLRANRT